MVKDTGVEGALLHVRGEHSRGDIAGRLSRQVDEAVAYRQASVPLSEKAREILAGKHAVILPLFSPRTAQLFFKHDLQINAPVQVVAISSAVNEAILGTNPTKNINILIAETPDAAAMLRAIKGRIDT
jgi:uroporphyrinogen-III synthase